MGLQLTFWSVQETSSGNAKRRAVAAFASDSLTTTPAAMGCVATDSEADPLAERTAGALVSTTADSTTGGADALPALASRRWFLLENQSTTHAIWWKFGATITAGAGFYLRPGGRVSFNGDLPNDALRVICDPAETALVVGQQC